MSLSLFFSISITRKSGTIKSSSTVEAGKALKAMSIRHSLSLYDCTKKNVGTRHCYKHKLMLSFTLYVSSFCECKLFCLVGSVEIHALRIIGTLWYSSNSVCENAAHTAFRNHLEKQRRLFKSRNCILAG